MRRLTTRLGFAGTVPVADESITRTLKCPVLQNLSQNFYLQIEFTFPLKT